MQGSSALEKQAKDTYRKLIGLYKQALRTPIDSPLAITSFPSRNPSAACPNPELTTYSKCQLYPPVLWPVRSPQPKLDLCALASPYSSSTSGNCLSLASSGWIMNHGKSVGVRIQDLPAFPTSPFPTLLFARSPNSANTDNPAQNTALPSMSRIKAMCFAWKQWK